MRREACGGRREVGRTVGGNAGLQREKGRHEGRRRMLVCPGRGAIVERTRQEYCVGESTPARGRDVPVLRIELTDRQHERDRRGAKQVEHSGDRNRRVVGRALPRVAMGLGLSSGRLRTAQALSHVARDPRDEATWHWSTRQWPHGAEAHGIRSRVGWRALTESVCFCSSW